MQQISKIDRYLTSRMRRILMLGLIAALAIIATLKLVPAYRWLVVENSPSTPIDFQHHYTWVHQWFAGRWLAARNGPSGPIDFRYYYTWVHQWFAGLPVYRLLEGSEYPPASMVMLYPLVGWLDIATARWWWAITGAIALLGLAILLIQGSQATDWRGRIFVVLMLLSMGGTGVAIANGQLILHLLPPLMLGLMLLHRQPLSWRIDVAVAVLLLWTLIKPSVSAPFMWLAIFVRGDFRMRPILLTGVGYLSLTLFAARYQEMSLWDLILLPVRSAGMTAISGGHANIQMALAMIGLQNIILPASLLIFFGFGAWIYYYRKIDFWILLSLSALVARVWTYHRIYDNVLIVIPEIALFRLIQKGNWCAGILLALNVVAMSAPGSPSSILPWWNSFLETVDTIVIIIDLIFFLNVAWRARSVTQVTGTLQMDAPCASRWRARSSP